MREEVKIEKDLNTGVHKEQQKMSLQKPIGVVLIILSIYSVFFSIAPKDLLIKIIPALSNYAIVTGNNLPRLLLFVGNAYFLFIFGFILLVGWKKFKKMLGI
ncbi:MAG: hypothetical protein ABID64_01070 [Nitrospirota bacterium]